MTTRTFWRLLLCLMLLPLTVGTMVSGCSRGQAADYSFVSTLEGNAQIKKTGTAEWVKAELNTALSANDTIKTGPNERLSVTFFDGSTIDLEPNTQIEVKELVQGDKTSIRLKQEIGNTLSKVKKLADPASRYEIETPAAVAGVRGSEMKVNVSADGTTEVQNIEGNIFVKAQGIEIQIPPGNRSTVTPGKEPSTPVPSTPEPTVYKRTDITNDVFGPDGKIISGYGYLNQLTNWIENKNNMWVVTQEVAEDIPESLASPGLIEWDVMVDADKDSSTGWKSELLFNDLGIDYYISLSLSGSDLSVHAQRTADLSGSYPNLVNYHTNGQQLSIGFNNDTIGNTKKFKYIIVNRQYAVEGDAKTLLAADKSPSYEITIATP
jgi:hypothetical protein